MVRVLTIPAASTKMTGRARVFAGVVVSYVANVSTNTPAGPYFIAATAVTVVPPRKDAPAKEMSVPGKKRFFLALDTVTVSPAGGVNVIRMRGATRPVVSETEVRKLPTPVTTAPFKPVIAIHDAPSSKECSKETTAGVRTVTPALTADAMITTVSADISEASTDASHWRGTVADATPIFPRKSTIVYDDINPP
jgi:hypothetical protein